MESQPRAGGEIVVSGARVHNLKNVSVAVPRGRLVAFTGVSGSGKTSLAYDTIFAEGQRRYFETLSAYFRQFVVGAERPDVDFIEGISPSISVDQRGIPVGARSTVGTITEIYDYLRLLFNAVGRPHCPDCGVEIRTMTVERIHQSVAENLRGRMTAVLAPVVAGRKGVYRELIEKTARSGYQKIRVDGKIYNVDDPIPMARYRVHNIEIVIDRLAVEPKNADRLLASIRLALREGGGSVIALDMDGGEVRSFSSTMGCPKCGRGLPRVSPKLFSFNSPAGACPGCGGTAELEDFDPELVVPDWSKSLGDGAVVPFAPLVDRYEYKLTEAAIRDMGFSKDSPLDALSPRHREVLLHGGDRGRHRIRYRSGGRRYRFATAAFPGVLHMLRDRLERTTSERTAAFLTRFMSRRACPECGGARLRPDALAFRLGGRNIAEISAMPVERALEFLESLPLSDRERSIGGGLLSEVVTRLGFMCEVGLPYLTLDRAGWSLSGGEYQRVRLASQIGTALSGVTYVLDEPSVGLHARDAARLMRVLKRLRDMDNTVIVVEHDEYTIRQADHIVDLGPAAGRLGGEVVAQGTVSDVTNSGRSLTGEFLAGRKKLLVPEKRRAPGGERLVLTGASGNNLKNVTLSLPLGLFTCFTGVSGSGKSSLVFDTLHHAVRRALGLTPEGEALPCDSLAGHEHLDRVLVVDSSPIGKTSRSTPATYTGVLNDVRALFSLLPEARARGYKPGRFSYNVRGGRCGACEGHGVKKIEMHFLPDVFVKCGVCGGSRYNGETLEVRFRGKSIGDVLMMTCEEALELFGGIPKIRGPLQLISDIGLGYLLLGQPAPTLSAGEAQRIKLSAELKSASRKRTLYLLDEPTTGLHFSDVQKLLDIIARLVDRGNTVVVIEHNLDVVKSADWIIDMGPEGGDGGGWVVAEGAPEEVAENPLSLTGKFLGKVLKR
ncbi:MAG: excinuclease ABC subunit UvrA [bacterium]